MAVFSDPAGAAFGVWQPAEHKGFQVRNEPGTVCWHELMTTDVAASSGFYPAVFGWTVASHGPAEGPGGYTEFRIGEKMIAGMMAKPPMMPAEVPPHWGLYFAVDDADAAAAKVTELGGKVLMGPMDIEPGRVVAVADTAGATFTLLKSSR
jgi:predicted enzyme related to lactoylglutathione lyase